MTARRPPSRYPLTIDIAVALACAAADDHPGFVVLMFDDTGVQLAVRPTDLPPPKLAESCRTLLGLLTPEGRGSSVVVSVEPGFGLDAERAVSTWDDLAASFDEYQAVMLDWLLVLGEEVLSVVALTNHPSPW